jgi:hypothetical protein
MLDWINLPERLDQIQHPANRNEAYACGCVSHDWQCIHGVLRVVLILIPA